MADQKELVAKAMHCFEEAKLAILTDPSAENLAKSAKLMTEGNAIKAQIDQLRAIMAAADGLQSLDQAGGRASDPGVAKFKGWGEFLTAAFQFGKFQKLDARLRAFDTEHGEIIKDLSATTGSTGGFLIPEEQQDTLLAATAEASIMRQRATIIPMKRQLIKIPRLTQTEALSAGLPRWFGGMIFYWRAQGQPLTATEAKFGQVELAVKELIGYTAAENELVQDSAISLEAFLAGPMGFAGGIAWMEDFAFIQGNGAGQPLGFLNAPCTLATSRDSDNHIVYADLVNMQQHFLPSAAKGIWLISISAFAQIMMMETTTGFPIWANTVAGGPNTLLGRPYIVTEKMPVLGQVGDIALIDPTYYLIGDRQATTVEATQYDKWNEFKTSWRVMHRVDGEPWLEAPITLQDNSTQVSPFVVLAAHTS
jgi:HK97 family phage major capsid protein